MKNIIEKIIKVIILIVNSVFGAFTALAAFCTLFGTYNAPDPEKVGDAIGMMLMVNLIAFLTKKFMKN